jgi:hypothetical protein
MIMRRGLGQAGLISLPAQAPGSPYYTYNDFLQAAQAQAGVAGPVAGSVLSNYPQFANANQVAENSYAAYVQQMNNQLAAGVQSGGPGTVAVPITPAPVAQPVGPVTAPIQQPVSVAPSATPSGQTVGQSQSAMQPAAGGSTVTTSTTGVDLSSIPWWGWALGAGALFFAFSGMGGRR